MQTGRARQYGGTVIKISCTGWPPSRTVKFGPISEFRKPPSVTDDGEDDDYNIVLCIGTIKYDTRYRTLDKLIRPATGTVVRAVAVVIPQQQLY